MADDDGVCSFCCRSVEMNTAEFLGSLESSTMMGLDVLNNDSIWDHSEAAEEEEVAREEMGEEEVAEEEVSMKTKLRR